MIEARGVTVEIAGKKLLDNVSLQLGAHETIVVIGQNGAGKSTLRKVLSGEQRLTNGAVWMNGKPLADIPLVARAKMRAVLPQESSLSFPFSVLEVVLMGRAPHVQTSETKHDYEIAKQALNAVEAAHLEARIYPTLSGGERQRVQMARVLTQIWEKPETANCDRFLLLDEPTASLDLAHQHQTLRIVRRLTRQKIGALIILHDLNLAAQYADRVVLLKSGKIIADDHPRRALTAELIEQTLAVSVTIAAHPHSPERLLIIPNEATFEDL